MNVFRFAAGAPPAEVAGCKTVLARNGNPGTQGAGANVMRKCLDRYSILNMRLWAPGILRRVFTELSQWSASEPVKCLRCKVEPSYPKKRSSLQLLRQFLAVGFSKPEVNGENRSSGDCFRIGPHPSAIRLPCTRVTVASYRVPKTLKAGRGGARMKSSF
jgi:hypothetical protein